MAETMKKASTPRKPRAKAATPKTSKSPNSAIETMSAPKPKKNSAQSPVTTMNASHEQVAQRAHQLWLERGGSDGYHLEDWYRAERELMHKAS